ncbi:hypothetical protein ABK040_014821 [Willaertia magna]
MEVEYRRIPSSVIRLFINKYNLSYNQDTLDKINLIMDSPKNINVTTAINSGQYIVFDNEINSYARGDLSWNELTRDAKERYFEQSRAFEDLGGELKKVAPELSEKLNHFYNTANRIIQP